MSSPIEAVRWAQTPGSCDEVRTLASEVERGWRFRSALMDAFVAHASQEGQDCCGAAFAGRPGAELCASWRRFFAALDGAE